MKVTKTILLLSLISLFADMASEMYYAITPIYLQSVGVSLAGIGLIEGVAEIIAGLTKGYFGNWSDAIQKRKPFITGGYFLSAISKPFVLLSNALVWLLAVRAVDRLGKGMRTAARDALLSNEATPKTKASVFAFHRAVDTVGAIIGPSLVLFFLHYNIFTIKQLFIFGLIPGLMSVAIIYFVNEQKPEVLQLKKRPGFFSFFGYWKKASLSYKTVTIALCTFFLFNSSDVFLIIKSNEIVGPNNGIKAVLLAYILYNVIYALISYPMGVIADLIGKRKVMIIGLIVYAMVYFGFSLAKSNQHILMLFLFYGIYAAATDGIAKAWISNLAPKNEQATALGLFSSLQSIALTFASIIAGLFAQVWHSNFIFYSGALAASVVAFFLLFFGKKVEE
jgi:MFS family permease